MGFVVGRARSVCARRRRRTEKDRQDAPTKEELAEAKESLLAAEGSDWCWWYGPEHSTANDAEFDALYRKHLTGVYLALGLVAPEELAKPIKRMPERAYQIVAVDVFECESGWDGFELLRMAGRGRLFAGAAGRIDARARLLFEGVALRI